MVYYNVGEIPPIGSNTVPPTGNSTPTQKNDVNAKITEYFQCQDTIPQIKADTLSDKDRLDMHYNEQVRKQKEQNEKDLKETKENIKLEIEQFKEKYPEQTEALKRFEKYSQMNWDELFEAYKTALENDYSLEEKSILHLEMTRALIME